MTDKKTDDLAKTRKLTITYKLSFHDRESHRNNCTKITIAQFHPSGRKKLTAAVLPSALKHTPSRWMRRNAGRSASSDYETTHTLSGCGTCAKKRLSRFRQRDNLLRVHIGRDHVHQACWPL